MKNEVCLSKKKLSTMKDENEVAVYTSLKIMFDRMRTNDTNEIRVIINPQILYYELSESFNLTRTDKTKLENGIKGLIERNDISLIDTDNKGDYVLDISNLYIDSINGENYTKVRTDEIIKIINIPYKQKYNLLRLGLTAYGFIYNQNKCGFASIAKLQETSKIKSKTRVYEMMKILEENNVFYVCHSNIAKRDSNGQIKQLSNVYGRPEDKTAIYNYFLDRLYQQGYDFTKKMDSQTKARITRNYNLFIKDKYEGDTLELIKDCLKYNEIPYAKKKDMTIFNEEDIEKMKEEIKNEIKENKKELLKTNPAPKIKEAKPRFSRVDDIPF